MQISEFSFALVFSSLSIRSTNSRVEGERRGEKHTMGERAYREQRIHILISRLIYCIRYTILQVHI